MDTLAGATPAAQEAVNLAAPRRRPFVRLPDLRDNQVKYLLVLPAMLVVAGMALWPLAYSLLLSFRSWRLARSPIPGPFVGITNYEQAFSTGEFWLSVGNSALFVALSVAFTTALALGLALLLVRGGLLRRSVQTLLILPFAMSPALVGISWPAVVIVLPFFLMFRSLGILDTRPALILVDTAIVMPFAVWMIKGFVDGIPLETEEAALVDGSTRLQVLRRVVLPMAAPGIITAAIFAFIISWNEFLFALILTRRDAVTLPVGLQLFNGQEGMQWHLLSAAGLLIMAPMIVLALLVQKHFVQGMTMGAVR